MIAIKAFWQTIKSELEANRKIVLAMIIEKSGSAPRGVGAHMLILADGSTIDTIGGGILEHMAVEEAKQNLISGKSIVRAFSLNNKDAGNAGMVCGGAIKVALYCFQPQDLPQITKAVQLFSIKDKLVVDLSWQAEHFTFQVHDLAEAFAGKEQLVKKSLLLSEDITKQGQYLEVMKQSPMVYIFGGGYVAQEVAKLLSNLEFEYVIVEERLAFANKDLFPGVKRIAVVDYADFATQVDVKSTDFAVVVTNGHSKDTLVLETLLKKPPAYLGVIGSRHKKAHVENILREKGFSSEVINQMILPIGLDIKAETPAEIAISIVAQLIEKRAQ